MACAVLADAIRILRAPVVTRADEAKRAFEVAFFRDPGRCAKWCGMAGWDYDAVVSKLDVQGLLVPSATIDVDAPEAPPMFVAPPPARKRRRGAEIPPERRGKAGRIPDPSRGVQRLLARLPRNAGAACTAKRMAGAIGTSVTYVNYTLRRLEAEGRVASSKSAAMERKSARKWWRVR